MWPGVVFVEDPGAVNCIAPIIEPLARAGFPPQLLASGFAVNILQERGVAATAVSSPDEAIEILRRSDARWLLTGTSENLDSIAFALTLEARKSGIASAAIVDSAANAESRFRGRSEQALTYAPDWLLLPDEWTAESFYSIGYASERSVIVGHPHYDYLKEQVSRLRTEGRQCVRARCLPQDAIARKVLVFASEVSTGLDAQQYLKSPDYTISGRGVSIGRTQIVVEEFLDAIGTLTGGDLDRPYLVLRLHPKDTGEELKEHIPHFDHVSSGPGVLDLLYSADLVVGMSSMILQEAHLMGTPVISILPRQAEKDWLPIIRSGQVKVVMSRAEITAALSEVLRAPRLDDLRRNLNNGDLGGDAGCIQRVVQSIGMIVGARRQMQ